MKKRLLVLFLVMALITSIYLPTGASAAADGGTVTPVVIDNSPVQSCQPLDCAVDVINGDDYLYTTSSGIPAVFIVYNIDDRKVVASHKLTGLTTWNTNACWKHIIDSNHNVYLLCDITLFKYDPFQDTMTNLGAVWPGETRSFVIDKDENDNIYIGTYPGGKIIKYDPVQNEYSDLGTVEPGSKYVRSLVYHNGYLYAGVKGDGLTGKFYKINADNPSEKVYYPLPDNTVVDPDYYRPDEIGWLYSMTSAGDYIIIWTYTADGARCPMLVFDTQNDRFLTDIGFSPADSFNGLYSSPVLDNKSYFFSGGKAKYFDLTTARVVDTGWATSWITISTVFAGWGWVTLENNPDYPNHTLVTIDKKAGNLIFYNMETQNNMIWYDCKLPGGDIAIQSLENGPGGDVYIGAYMASNGAKYNPVTGETMTYPMGQPEGMVEYNGKQYFGVYPGAKLRVFDPLLPVSGTNPIFLGKVGEQQDRPFAMAAADDKIFMGTFPDYGLLGGALAIYDLETKQMKTIRNIVQDQSVMSITYKDGFIYGTTAIYGGLGSVPVDQPAKIFIYDVENDRKVKEFVPNIKENFKPYYLGGIAFDKNGKLWVATGYTIFSVDPETEVVSDVLSTGEFNYSLTQGTYRPKYLRFDDLGLMYVNLNGMKIINPENMKYVDVTPVSTNLYTIGEDNNLYYADGSKLMMVSHEQIIAGYLDDLVVAPEFEILSPEDGATYFLSQEVTADWAAGDEGTAIASESGTAAKGTSIDTSSVGTKSFTVEVVDNYGFRTSKTVSYEVVYPFAGVLQPAGKDKAHKSGSTIPVKFQLYDANNNPVANAVARLYYAKLEDGLPVQENEAVSTGSANDGNAFRNDSNSNQYIFNLKTTGWSAGKYQLRIQLDDGKSHTLVIDVE